ELNVVLVSVGDRAEIELDALPGRPFPGTVQRIDAMGQTRMGEMTYRLVVEPQGLPAEVRWNMTAQVSIALDEG
ncbi:MAG: efflux RND transporter periplasmic adaptor subunit, partial [Chloroflexi bacterium]|nr:efflux RND transporter periplasmic adaptor subunit [Chloroflexota bacterium]